MRSRILAFNPDHMASTDKPEQRREATDQSAGYIRLYRKLLENPIWTQLAPAVLKVALYFLLRAGYRPIQWYDGTRTINIPAGAFITSYDRVAKDCNLSKQQVRGAFTHLFRTHFATYRRTHRWTLVIVCNWATYQASADGAEHTGEHKADHFRNTKQEVKNINTLSAGKPASEGLFDINDPPFSTLDPEVNHDAGNESNHSSGASRNGNGRAPKIREAIARVASNIHQRHPSAFGRRDCSVARVEKHLAAILKHRKVPACDQEMYLETIDRNHAAICASESWRKDGGQFAKGLENWLAPTKERYENIPEPSVPAANHPPRLIL